ncbi:MAG TPA: FAD-dependent oxidoreductase [Pyrinomonadaceae bacterium]|nr:FAD-dependent oxidoreductase [Pyrinomonadaceae bacterium]
MALKKADFDVIIIGGGPGGLSAAFWCAELGLKTLLLEKEDHFGGQLLRTFNEIKNHLGVEAANGREMRDIFLRQVEKKDIRRLCGCTVVSGDLIEKTVVTADGSSYSSRAIIIATGVSRRKLGIPGEAEFYGRGILDSGERSKNDVAGKSIVIVGGGDAALENALILSRTAEKVFVVHRRSEFSAREEFVEGCRRNENIEFVTDVRAAAIIGNTAVEAVELDNILSGTHSRIPADAVLIRVGEEPNTDLFRGQIDLDAAGFIRVDENCATGISGVFAVGDVANPIAPTISAAVGMGTVSAKAVVDSLAAFKK